MRNILLIEPNYKNKYPPMGLMKIATYHKMLGDNVRFFKGDLKELIIEDIVDSCIAKLCDINEDINWNDYKSSINEYIKRKQSDAIDSLFSKEDIKYIILIKQQIIGAKDSYWKKKWENEPKYDRVYVTTLFTFYWNITIDTINVAKKLVKNISELKVGGIASTILPDDIYKDTGIKPIKGLLNKKGILDKGNNLIIDDLPLDYSILKEIDYQYPESDAYYGYMTRGCIRNCSFCAVTTLEPNYVEYLPVVEKIKKTIETFGEQRNLLLLDNNVLASERFLDIIREIKDVGFAKGATYTEPDQFQICIKNLSKGVNDRAYLKESHRLLANILNRLKGEAQQNFYNELDRLKLLRIDSVTKDAVNEITATAAPLYAKHFNRKPRQRFVDFNQGVDARLINEENIKLLSEISIRPLRIAFDSMAYEKPYKKAVKLAISHGITHLSNYLLYNEKDKPVELYQRLRINVDLCEDLEGVSIYSFPMKFHPIMGEQRFNRDYMGKHWNRKFIRAVQAVLNATKGKIGKGKSFFEKAFGKDEGEFMKILYMPETYILYRLFFEENDYTRVWWEQFNELDNDELAEAKTIIESNQFADVELRTSNPRILSLLKHYLIKREDVIKNQSEQYELKNSILL